MRPRFFFLAPLFFLGFLAFLALGGFVVQWLWNWLLPSLFGLPVVTFWQALGLLALSRILFGRIGGGRGHGWRGGHMRSRFRARMAERFHGMSSEQRERFGRATRGAWGVNEPLA